MNIHLEATKKQRGDMRPENERVIDKPTQRELWATIILLIAVLCVLTGCSASWRDTSADIDYKAVFLDNGHALFGRLEESGPSHVTLKEVLYATGGTCDNKVVKSVGSEIWHGCDPLRLDTRNIVAVIDTDYKAVFLDNGRAYFGRLLERTTDYVLLKDVFLIEREMTQEWGGKTARVILVKGKDGRQPQDHMFINAGHILAVMPVSERSGK